MIWQALILFILSLGALLWFKWLNSMYACISVWLRAHIFVFVFVTVPRYWSRIDGLIREALILRKVRVRLLISCWEKTHPLTFNFIWSLRSLCMDQANCSLEAVSTRPLFTIFNSRDTLSMPTPPLCLCVCVEVLQPQSAEGWQSPGNKPQQVYSDRESHLFRWAHRLHFMTMSYILLLTSCKSHFQLA